MALHATSESKRPLRREVAVSVVVPVYNEQASLPELHRRLRAVLDQLGGACGIVYVDAGSTERPRGLREGAGG